MTASKLTRRAFRKLVGHIVDEEYYVIDSVQIALVFYPRDPFEVLLAVSCRHESCTSCGDPVEWTFAVDLLRDGLHQPAGLGDIQVWPGDGIEKWPDAGIIWVRLSSPDGTSVISLAAAPVRRFLAQVEERVPRGTEAIAIPDYVDGAK